MHRVRTEGWRGGGDEAVRRGRRAWEPLDQVGSAGRRGEERREGVRCAGVGEGGIIDEREEHRRVAGWGR